MEKVCVICNSVFTKKIYPSGKIEGQSRFNERKCCSKKCGLILGNRISSQNRIKNPDEIKLGRQERSKKYYQRDKEILLKKQSDRWKNDEEFRKRRTHYILNRKKNDPLFKITVTLRNRVNKSIIKEYKKSSTIEMLGISIDEVRKYIENLWLPGMTWDNHGIKGWHIDHIKPLSSCTNEKDMIELCHYSNLQPLWCEDNLQKGCKII